MDYKQFVKSSISKSETMGIVKFLVLKDYSAGAIHVELRKIFANEAPSQSTVKRWCAALKKRQDIGKRGK